MANSYIDFLICIAKYLAFDGAIIASCLGFGSLFSALLQGSSRNLEKKFFAFVLGAGVWMCCVFVAGLVHAISKPLLLTLFVVSILLLINPWFRTSGAKVTFKDRKFDWLTICLISAAFLTSFWYSLYPARFYEDLNYHLPLARFFLSTHSIDPAWHLRFPVGSQGTNLLFLPLLAFGGDIAAQQLSVVSFVVFTIGIYTCAERFGRNVKAGQFAVLASLTGTHVLEMSTVAFIDMNFALFVSAAIYAGLCYCDPGSASGRENRLRWAILTGVFFGLSIASSLMGIVALLSFVALDAAEVFVLPAGKNDKRRWSDIYGLLLIGFTALLLSAPWFIRSFIYTKNPIFPFGAELFGLGGIWNRRDSYAYVDLLRENYGLSKDFIEILYLPWKLSLPPAEFTEPSLTPTLLLGLLTGIPMSFLPHSQILRRLLFLICSIILVWFFWGHHTTYLLGIVPAVSVLTGICLARFWPYVPKDKPTRIFVVAFCTVVVLLFGAVEHSLAFLVKNNDPIVATPAIRSTLLDRWVPINAAFEFANKLPLANLYTYRNPDVKYLYKGITYGDEYGLGRFNDFKTAAHDGGSLKIFLNKYQITYLVVERKALPDLPTDDYFKRHFHILFSDDAAVLYKCE